MIDDMADHLANKANTHCLFNQFCDDVAQMGYDRIAYVNFSQLGSDNYDPRSTITYTKQWLEHYTSNNYFEQDVLFGLAQINRLPIFWDDVRKDPHEKLNSTQRSIFDDSEDAGHRRGITMPFHGPDGLAGTISVATSGADSDIEQDRTNLFGLAARFHAMYDITVNPTEITGPLPKMPPREMECLRWVADGKTSWEIAKITNLTPNTVDTYLKRVMQRLGVRNRIAAVMTANRLGLLSPNSGRRVS